MKIKGLVYLFTPLKKDFNDLKSLREHLVRPTAGRLFLQKEQEDKLYSIPFSSITKLIQILYKVHLDDYDFTCKTVDIFVGTLGEETKFDRRCLRISIEGIDAGTDPLRYAEYAGKLATSRKKFSDFSLSSIGLLTSLDLNVDDKHHKLYFTDFFDAGIKLNKMFSAEVAKRIPLNGE